MRCRIADSCDSWPASDLDCSAATALTWDELWRFLLNRLTNTCWNWNIMAAVRRITPNSGYIRWECLSPVVSSACVMLHGPSRHCTRGGTAAYLSINRWLATDVRGQSICRRWSAAIVLICGYTFFSTKTLRTWIQVQQPATGLSFCSPFYIRLWEPCFHLAVSNHLFV